jgi:3-phosphoshikimate 1-carboxyvinyltransferase
MADLLPIQVASRPISGTPALPGSKSITNRALVLAALADGRSTIEGALVSDDTEHMIAALNVLGIPAELDRTLRSVQVRGCGGAPPVRSATVYAGNAGTVARFLTPVLALGNGEFRLDGDPRMRTRPIQPLLDALRDLGSDAVSELDTGCPPVRVRARGLAGGVARVNASLSSQFMTGLLLAAPSARADVSIEVGNAIVSEPYVEMTLRMMAQWGIEVVEAYRVPAPQARPERTYAVEPDATAASYFMAAAAISGGTVHVDGLGRDSLQGDVAFADVLESMGCRVTRGSRTITVAAGAQLRGVSVDMNGISDTVMTLAAVAPFAAGPTRIRNVAHIRVKECDRISAVTTELRRLGVPCDEHADGLTIYPSEPHGAIVETYNDHRIAMSFALIGLRAPGVAIRNPACVTKTFPNYFDELGSLATG